MNHFTIKDIENLSGIKAHAWRIWEQRYDMGVAQRKDSKHRVYNGENLKTILRIAYLYHAGVKISTIAALTPDEIRQMALTKMPESSIYEFYVKELVEASIDFDEKRFEFTFSEALKRLGLCQTMVKVIFPFEEKIGMLWLTDHVIPANEHFTSHIITRKMMAEIDKLPLVAGKNRRTIVLFAPENERHEIPLLLIKFLLRENGDKVVYFGLDTKLSTIQQYLLHHNCTHLMFHLITNFTTLSATDYLQTLAAAFPNVEIVMSGAQIKTLSSIPANALVLKSIDEVIAFAGGNVAVNPRC